MNEIFFCLVAVPVTLTTPTKIHRKKIRTFYPLDITTARVNKKLSVLLFWSRRDSSDFKLLSAG